MRSINHPMKSQSEHYMDLLDERKNNPCTPEQQKGLDLYEQSPENEYSGKEYFDAEELKQEQEQEREQNEKLGQVQKHDVYPKK